MLVCCSEWSAVCSLPAIVSLSDELEVISTMIFDSFDYTDRNYNVILWKCKWTEIVWWLFIMIVWVQGSSNLSHWSVWMFICVFLLRNASPMASVVYFPPIVPQGQKALQISILFICHIWLLLVSQCDTVASAGSFAQLVDSRNEMKLESVYFSECEDSWRGWKWSPAQCVNANTLFTLNRVSNCVAVAVCSSEH